MPYGKKGTRAMLKKSRGKWPKGYCPIPPEKRAQKGQVRNPFGKPKGTRNVCTILRDIDELMAPPETLRAIKKFFPQIVSCSVQEAELLMVKIKCLTADPWAVEFSTDRVEGKVPQVVTQDTSSQIRKKLTDEQCKIAAKALNLTFTKSGNEIKVDENGKKIIHVRKKEEGDDDDE